LILIQRGSEAGKKELGYPIFILKTFLLPLEMFVYPKKGTSIADDFFRQSALHNCSKLRLPYMHPSEQGSLLRFIDHI
jgi:hypothetical protein